MSSNSLQNVLYFFDMPRTCAYARNIIRIACVSLGGRWASNKSSKKNERAQRVLLEKFLSAYKRQNVRYIDGFRDAKYPSCIW